MLDPRAARLADQLIPAAEGRPAASEADPQGKWLGRALAARPDLADAWERALAVSDARALEEADSEAFTALTAIVAGAYYMNPKGRKRIGYPGPKTSPPLPDEADYYVESLLPDLPPPPAPGAPPAARPAAPAPGA